MPESTPAAEDIRANADVNDIMMPVQLGVAINTTVVGAFRTLSDGKTREELVGTAALEVKKLRVILPAKARLLTDRAVAEDPRRAA